MKKKPSTMQQLIAMINEDAKELERLSKMSPMEFLAYVNKDRTDREIGLSRLLGSPVKIKN